MDKLYELERFTFVKARDGSNKAIQFADQCKKLYMAALKAKRKKFGKNFTYRKEYLEGAYSFRHLSITHKRN